MDPVRESARSPGRPRLHEPDAERNLILRAALEVLRRNEGAEATVADVLQEASLSTRAFYRHFETKEDVIRALYEHDAESFGAHLRGSVEAAGDPWAALAAWVNEVLGLAYDHRRAARMTALSSAMVRRVVDGTRAEELGNDVMTEPLHKVLEDGVRSGAFAATRPDQDVHTIRAITMEAVAWARSGTVKLTRREALDHVLRFVEGALVPR
jgi:AcrR family transcriptional regulator